jgi:hypothetical protein
VSDTDPDTVDHDHPPPDLSDPLPSQHPAVASVVVDGETVLYDERDGRSHILNPTAGVIWSCLGFAGTVHDLVADLAAAYSVPADAIAEDVLATLATLDRNELLNDGRPPPTVSRSGDVRYLEEAQTGCMAAVDRLGWATTVGVELPTGLRVGVRTDTDETAAVVRRVLGSLVVDDPACPPNLSVRLEPPTPGPVRSLHTLYRSCSLAVRTRRRARAVDALLHQLWSLVAVERDDVPQVTTTGLERDGVVVLAPPRLRSRIGAVEPSLRRAGIAVVDAPVVALGPGDPLGVVIDRPPLWPPHDLDRSADEPAEGAGVELRSPPPGNYRVAGRLLVGRPGTSERSKLLVGALADIANVGRIGGAAALTAAARLSGAPTVVAASWGTAPLTDAAVALFETG